MKKYKHNEDMLGDACGINREKLLQKLSNVMDEIDKHEDIKSSEIIEILEKKFNKRELAFLFFIASEVIFSFIKLFNIPANIIALHNENNRDMYV